MDVIGFQNFIPVQPPASPPNQTVPAKQTAQKAPNFATKLENAFAHPMANDSGQETLPALDNEKQLSAAGTGDLENQEIGDEALDAGQESILSGIPDNGQTEYLAGQETALLNISIMPQISPQANLPQPNITMVNTAGPDETDPQLDLPNQTKNIETENGKVQVPSKETQPTPGKSAQVFDVDALTKKQPAQELSASKDQQTILSNQKANNTLTPQTELPKNTINIIQTLQSNQTAQTIESLQAADVQPAQTTQTVLANILVKPVQLNPQNLDSTTNTQVVNLEEELADSQAVNLTGKESKDSSGQQEKPTQQSQYNNMPLSNPKTADLEAIKSSDQRSDTSAAAFSIPTADAVPTATGKPTATNTPGQAEPNFNLPKDDQIKSQIIDQVRLINRENQESEMIIRLKPEHLGELVLKVAVVNGAVNANFHSNNPEVRNLLEVSLHQLKQDLAEAGFKVDNVSISAGLNQFAAGQDRQLEWQRQTLKSSGKKGANGYVEGVDSSAASQTGVNFSKNDGVDYLI